MSKSPRHWNLGLFAIAYVVMTGAASVVAFFHLRYAHCGELSSLGSCDFIRGAGGPLLLFVPAVLVGAAAILALWRRRPLVLHVSAAVVVASVIILDATTVT